MKKRKKNKEKVKYRTEKTPFMNQDDVQRYLAAIAPEGPIREYVDANAAANGGLCAGWVAIHRREPENLIYLWNEVAYKVEEWEEGEEAPVMDPEVVTEDALRMYIKAHDHFVSENEGADFVRPGREAKEAAGMEGAELEDAPLDGGNKKNRIVKYGAFVEEVIKVGGTKGEVFVEIYTQAHEAQVQLVNGKVISTCETEKAGILETVHKDHVESILTSAFFSEDDDEDDSIQLTMIAHKRLE